MAWKLVNLPVEIVEKLEVYMRAQQIEVYWKAIERLLQGETENEPEQEVSH